MKKILTCFEKIIFDKYGKAGLRIYALCDGKRSGPQIMKETKVSESELVKILDYLNEQGMIGLYHKDDKST